MPALQMGEAMDLKSELYAAGARLSALRRDLHAHPELAFEEARTAGVIAAHLEALGVEVHRGVGGTGVVGAIHNGAGPGIGLRADMDALPMQEENTFAHRSVHAGCMHACGHDGHMAMLLAAAEVLARHKPFAGSVYLLFQPAEEGDGGAPAMIADGLFERFPMQAVFGMHNWPGLPAGSFAVHDGPVMACTDDFDIVVRGQGAHAAMPQRGVDPVLVGAELVLALQSVASRSLDPLDNAVLSVTTFHAGDANNVIPDQAVLSGTVRAFSRQVEARIETRMRAICEGLGAAHEAQIALDYRRGYPATINTPAESALCAGVARWVAPGGQVDVALAPSMAADDFAYYLQHKPGCYVWIGNGPGEGGCMLHNARYDFNDALIPVGAAYWVELVRAYLAPQPAATGVAA